MPSQRYAIDGAILLKSVEENVQEVEGLPSTIQNEQDGEVSSLSVYC